ncbi:Origin recognition complex, subunit 1 [Chytriomyces hyalinus]|nr:Origin recognition complex, subunit 1 [Chytriomyces hyalinus]
MGNKASKLKASAKQDTALQNRRRNALTPVARTVKTAKKEARVVLDEAVESDEDCFVENVESSDDSSSGSEAESESESSSSEDSEHSEDEENHNTPRKRKRDPSKTTPKKRATPRALKVNLPKRKQARVIATDDYAQMRDLLHVSHVPDDLPCRDSQFEQVYTFLTSAIEKGGGECIYISGVPGTGKTATVRQVVKTLKEQVEEESLPKFTFIDINGMKLTDPNQAYCAIWEGLFPKWPKVSAKHACDLLQDFFRKPAQRDAVPIVLMVDELDLLVTTKQTVIYNLFNWPRLADSPLIMIAIANTMDLPERVFSHKINSRVGGTRLGFNAYTNAELVEIIESRVGTGGLINQDAVVFCAKKVAGMSGDARRALDICRKAIESLEEKKNIGPEAVKTYMNPLTGYPHVTIQLIRDVINDLFNPTVVPFIRNSSLHQQMFLLAIRKAMRKTGELDASFGDIADEHRAYCQPLSIKLPDTHLLQRICMHLYSTRLILMETGGKFGDPFQRIKLNVSENDLVVALKEDPYMKRILDRENR